MLRETFIEKVYFLLDFFFESWRQTKKTLEKWRVCKNGSILASGRKEKAFVILGFSRKQRPIAAAASALDQGK